MAEQRLLAAFFLSMAARPSPDDLPQLVRRVAFEVVRTAPWSPPGTPTVLGRWAGLDCEASLLQLSYYDVLVVTFRQDDFRALFRGSTGEAPSDRLQPVADAFIDACISTKPTSALLTSYAWIDPAAYLAELEDRVLGGDVPSLAREHIWLLYVTTDDVDLLTKHLPEASAELVRVPSGAVLFRELDAGRY